LHAVVLRRVPPGEKGKVPRLPARAKSRITPPVPKPEPLRAACLPAGFSAEPHLVGVSGGRDSIALLHWLHHRDWRQLIVCHLDHGLRSESAEEERFVQKFAKKLGCEFVSRRVDVATYARRQKLSVETAARELRYRFFAEVAQERTCPRLLLAHHADDQVETFLLQLLRGAGPSGLGGMAPVTTREIDSIPLTIARPFLGVWRSEIDAYIRQHRLRYQEDESNAELQHTRNRIRHLALPALQEAFGRDVRAALWRAAELLRAEDDFASAAPGLRDIPEQLDVTLLRSLPLALQRRLIHAWLRSRGIAGAGFEEVEGVRGLLDAQGAKVNLPGGRCARRRARRLFIDRQ
jgi:tRNA(Ile)-lysidine synthase